MLPRDFLAQMARECELSKEQQEVFLLRYGEELGYEEIATRLKTSQGACLKRMGEVYKKFEVSGSSRGKETRLRNSLISQYQKTSPPSFIRNSVEGLGSLKENLPRRECTTFIGRRQELSRLLQLLSFEKAANLISVDGVGGVGKTTLVLEAAHMSLQASTKQQTFEGTAIPSFEAIIFTSAKKQYLKALQILPRLKREHNLRDIYRTIAHTLEHPEIGYSPLEDQLELILDCLKRQRTLLIVDNLETIEDKQDVLSFVYELPPTVKVILTTREQAHFVPIRLESLSEEESLNLIYYQALEKGLDIVPTDAKALQENTYGIPAAIVYTIGQLAAGYGLADVLTKLKNPKGDLAQFCFKASVEPLRGQAPHRILMTLSLFPQAVERETIAAITLEDSINLGEGLAKLQQLSLVRQQDARYKLHPLTREYAAAELLNNPQFDEEIRARWVSWYITFSQKYGNLDEKKWFTSQQNHIKTEWENLREVIEWCKAKDKYEDLLTLWHFLKGYAHVRGHWDERQEWSAWLIEASKLRSDWSTTAEVLSDQGWTLTLTRQTEALEKASELLQQAWELRSYKDINFQLELTNRIAAHSIHQNNFDNASEWLKIKLSMLTQPGISEVEAQQQPIQTLYYQGKMLFMNGDYAQAKKVYKKALKMAETIKWRRLETLIQNWLADIAIVENDLETAQNILEQGLQLAELNEDKHSIAFHQRSFARLFEKQGNLELAKHWAILAADSFESLKMAPQAREMHLLADIKK